MKGSTWSDERRARFDEAQTKRDNGADAPRPQASPNVYAAAIQAIDKRLERVQERRELLVTLRKMLVDIAEEEEAA